MMVGCRGNLAFKIIDVFNSFMVGPVLISMKIKRLVAFWFKLWFKTLHMWRLSITSIVGIQLHLNGFRYKGITLSKILLVDPVVKSM